MILFWMRCRFHTLSTSAINVMTLLQETQTLKFSNFCFLIKANFSNSHMPSAINLNIISVYYQLRGVVQNSLDLLSSAPTVSGFLKLGRLMLFILIVLLGGLRKLVFMAKLLRGFFVVQVHVVKNSSIYIGFREQTKFLKHFPFNLRNRMIIEKASEKKHRITIFDSFRIQELEKPEFSSNLENNGNCKFSKLVQVRRPDLKHRTPPACPRMRILPLDQRHLNLYRNRNLRVERSQVVTVTE